MDKRLDASGAAGTSRQDSSGQTRREFLKRAGKYAAYTPPAMMMLMKPGFAQINGSVIGRPPTVVPAQPEAAPPSGDPRARFGPRRET